MPRRVYEEQMSQFRGETLKLSVVRLARCARSIRISWELKTRKSQLAAVSVTARESCKACFAHSQLSTVYRGSSAWLSPVDRQSVRGTISITTSVSAPK